MQTENGIILRNLRLGLERHNPGQRPVAIRQRQRTAGLYRPEHPIELKPHLVSRNDLTRPVLAQCFHYVEYYVVRRQVKAAVLLLMF